MSEEKKDLLGEVVEVAELQTPAAVDFITAPVPVFALQTKSIRELKAGREYRKSLAKSMIKGKFGKGAEFGSVTGIDNMVFKEGTQYIKDAFNLGTGRAISSKEEITLILKDNTKVTHYTITSDVPIINLVTGQVIAVGRATCSTLESKYRYRGKERVCPQCGEETIMKGLDQYGGGWYCNKKKGGCGAKFLDNEPKIIDQVVGKVENLNPDDVRDTATAMSIKRATTRMVLDVTGMSLYLGSGYEDKGKDHHKSQQADNTVEEEKRKKYQKEPPGKEGDKNYKALIKETLEGMFAGDQDVIDRKLISLTSFEVEDKKTKKMEKVKGTWDLEKISEKQAMVVWHKLEKEIEAKDNAEVDIGSAYGYDRGD